MAGGAPGLLLVGLLGGAVLGRDLLRAASPAALQGAGATPRAEPVAVDRHHVVKVQPDPHQAVRPGAVEGGNDERQRTHEMGSKRNHQLSLEQRLADQPEVEVLQVAETSMDELAGA